MYGCASLRCQQAEQSDGQTDNYVVLRPWHVMIYHDAPDVTVKSELQSDLHLHCASGALEQVQITLP